MRYVLALFSAFPLAALAAPTPIAGSTSPTASTVVSCADNDASSSTAERAAKARCIAAAAHVGLNGLWGDTSDDALVGSQLASWVVAQGLSTTAPQTGLLEIDGDSFPAVFLSPANAALHGVPAMALAVRDLDYDGHDDLAVLYVGNTATGAVHSQRWSFYGITHSALTPAPVTEFAFSAYNGVTGNSPPTHHYTQTSGTSTDHRVIPAVTSTIGAGQTWSAPRAYLGLGPLGLIDAGGTCGNCVW